jgi:hypothetical protein
MTGVLSAPPDADADRRWRAWQARGAEASKRGAVAMHTLIGIIAAALLGRLFVQIL